MKNKNFHQSGTFCPALGTPLHFAWCFELTCTVSDVVHVIPSTENKKNQFSHHFNLVCQVVFGCRWVNAESISRHTYNWWQESCSPQGKSKATKVIVPPFKVHNILTSNCYIISNHTRSWLVELYRLGNAPLMETLQFCGKREKSDLFLNWKAHVASGPYIRRNELYSKGKLTFPLFYSLIILAAAHDCCPSPVFKRLLLHNSRTR